MIFQCYVLENLLNTNRHSKPIDNELHAFHTMVYKHTNNCGVNLTIQ